MEALDHVAFLDIVVVLDADTALESGGDFLCVVLEPLQRRDLAFVDHDAVANQSDLGVSYDLALLDIRAADDAYARAP